MVLPKPSLSPSALIAWAGTSVKLRMSMYVLTKFTELLNYIFRSTHRQLVTWIGSRWSRWGWALASGVAW